MKHNRLISFVTALLVYAFYSSALFSAESVDNSITRLKTKAAQLPLAPLIEREKFNWTSPLKQVLLAPDGHALIYVLKQGQHQELWRYHIALDKHERIISAAAFADLQWTIDSNSLVYVDNQRLIRVSTQEANKAETIYQFEDSNTTFLKVDNTLSDSVWLLHFSSAASQYALVKIDGNGVQTKEFESKYPILDFWLEDGKVRFAKVQKDNIQRVLQLTENGANEIFSCAHLDPCEIQHWSESDQSLLVSGFLGNDLSSLYKVSLHSGNKIRLHTDPDGHFDLSQTILDESGQPYLAGYKTDYYQYYGLTEEAQSLIDIVERKTQSRLLSMDVSQDLKTWLIVDADPRHASIKYFVYSKTQERWNTPLSHIPTQKMVEEWVATRSPFTYKSTDGMTLFGYLTLPHGQDAAEVPLVTFPHGGPWTRTAGAFDRLTQFLANRGYAVFEPNFRGSTGMGSNYVLSANKDFGDGRVQQDIIDGVDFLLSQGIGDPKRLGIVGHSFGGFSAISALAFTPERFQVAFAGAAPNSLANSIQHFKGQMPPRLLEQRLTGFRNLMLDINDPADVTRLYDQSPDKHWRNIQKPLYMWAGEQDDRVAIEDVRDFALRLKGRNRRVTLLSDDRAGHSPEKPIAKEGYLYLLELSLAKHLKGRAEKEVSPALQRYLAKYTDIDTNHLVLASSE